MAGVACITDQIYQCTIFIIDPLMGVNFFLKIEVHLWYKTKYTELGLNRQPSWNIIIICSLSF